MKTFGLKTFILMLAFFCSFSTFAMSVDPAVHWHSLRTPHFEVIYDKTQKEVADRYGVAAEQAYDILKTRFSEMPSKTYILISDVTDEANGSATFLPYPIIQVYPVLPDTLSTLDYYGDWALEMIVHEYTHILTFQPANGFYIPFKYIFGSVVRPNGILPRWYLEGLAVESETHYTNYGRLKSPRTFAELRAFQEDNSLARETIDRLNETLIPEYPYGERPYLFGSALWQTMVRTGPPNVVDMLNQDYSRRVPFFLNGPVEDIFGMNYQGLLTKTYSEIETQTKEQVAKIETAGKEKVKKFKEDDMEQYSPAVSPNGKMLAYMTHSLLHGQVRMIKRDDNKVSFSTLRAQTAAESEDGLKISWLPDSSGFIFDGIDDQDPYHTFQALYRYNVRKKSVEKLKPVRAQLPAVSLDGTLVAFVKAEAGRTSLDLFNLKTKEEKLLFKPSLFERVDSPEFIAKDKIAFTLRNTAGVETLQVYDLASGQMKTYFENNKEVRRPRRTTLGVLVATIDSGVENISLANFESNHLRALTNTTTEMQSADWDTHAKELIVTRYTGSGRKLFTTTARFQNPPTVGRMLNSDWPAVPKPTEVSSAGFSDENYMPVEYLWPRYWIPFAYPVYNGVYLQGMTEHQDPAGINSYALSLAYDTVTHRGSYGAQYRNASLRPDIELSFIKSENYLGASSLVLTDQNANAGLRFYMPWLSPKWQGNVGYMTDQVQAPGVSDINRQGPFASLTYSSWTDPREESAGTIFQIGHQEYLSAPNSIHYGRTTLGATQGFTHGLPKSHRIYAAVQGSFAPDLPNNQLISLGDGSLGANNLVTLSSAQFLLRGYPTGTFVGRSVANWNLEYQFPISKKTHGWGTFPWFSRGWDAAIILDGLMTDGASYNPTDEFYHRRKFSDVALGTGFEGRWNTTVAYDLPLTWILGLYFGFDDKSQNNIMPFIGVAASDITAIDHLRKKWFQRSATHL
jgi:hypothetical protein